MTISVLLSCNRYSRSEVCNNNIKNIIRNIKIIYLYRKVWYQSGEAGSNTLGTVNKYHRYDRCIPRICNICNVMLFLLELYPNRKHIYYTKVRN